jgi:hypothetical protein
MLRLLILLYLYPNPIGIVDSDPVDRKTTKMFCTFDNTYVLNLHTY